VSVHGQRRPPNSIAGSDKVFFVVYGILEKWLLDKVSYPKAAFIDFDCFFMTAPAFNVKPTAYSL
jgi:hypothetical protein